MAKEKIKTPNELEGIVYNLKNAKKKVVTTNGVFDILHIGHIKYLEKAKGMGDALIVGINSDASTKRLKGEKRPLNKELDRAEALAALECVDFVFVFEEDTPVDFLEVLKPDVHVKGGDYKLSQIIEKEAVERNGGKVVLVPEIEGYATTKLINRIIEAYR